MKEVYKNRLISICCYCETSDHCALENLCSHAKLAVTEWEFISALLRFEYEKQAGENATPKLSSKAGIFLHENQRRAIEYISDDRIRLAEQLRDPVGLYKRVSAESHTLCKRSLGVVL